ncbi:hypothetical protein GPAL_2191 [Glaciecola pallidula DSM 14239 = ACAM 615]|uniref:Uncharacterized protein n=1 Tax=Brumicola pallidula DSM 14239 = ACAM 615 TaxID=1121922 RepID=K6ZFC3_9ALTE|nr:hypothetical protein GPAL_2191 [Glaciecola pallidula DSM 14239 = ACAM 615]
MLDSYFNILIRAEFLYKNKQSVLFFISKKTWRVNIKDSVNCIYVGFDI